METKKIICHDCGKVFKKGEEYVRFSGIENGDKFKCRACYETNPVLENYQECDVYSRVVGFHTPVRRWNKGKAAEWKDRRTFVVEAAGC